tara:strand:+ start:386 stop:601 length:216 start_codon:yes stop_codon:yes gene_type:complete
MKTNLFLFLMHTMKTKLIHIIKTKLIHIIYILAIAGIILLQSSMNVIEDEIRTEIACKNFIIDILKEKGED